MRITSVSAKEWRSSLLNRALTRLGVRPQDAMVVTGIGGSGPRTLTLMLYEVPGVTADRLEAEFGHRDRIAASRKVGDAPDRGSNAELGIRP